MKRLHIDVDSDTWYGVTDPKKRKRIQDRLAQRARRKRLANSKTIKKPDQTPPSRTSGSEDGSVIASTSPGSDNKLPSLSIADITRTQSSRPSTENATIQPSPTHSTQAATTEQISQNKSPISILNPSSPSLPSNQNPIYKKVSTLSAALANNALILNIPSGIQIPTLSRPVSHDMPQSLHPTETQMTTIHFPWIDRFPFPKMRDNMIRLNTVFDEEEFLADLFTGDGVRIVPGSWSWDPQAWVVSEAFQKKWGYLFR